MQLRCLISLIRTPAILRPNCRSGLVVVFSAVLLGLSLRRSVPRTPLIVLAPNLLPRSPSHRNRPAHHLPTAHLAPAALSVS